MNEEQRGITHKINTIGQELAEIKADMKQLVQAMTRLALAEERIGQVNAALERVLRKIDALEQDALKHKLDGVDARRTSVWVDRGIVAAVGAAVMYIAKKTGLL